MDGANRLRRVGVGHQQRDIPLRRSLRDGDHVDAFGARAPRIPSRQCPRCPSCLRRPPPRWRPNPAPKSRQGDRGRARTRTPSSSARDDARSFRRTDDEADVVLRRRLRNHEDVRLQIGRTTSNVFAAMPGMPCIPVPLISTSATFRMAVTALTPRADRWPDRADARAGMARVEAVENSDGNALAGGRKNRLVVQNLRPVVGQLRRLAIRNLETASRRPGLRSGWPSSRRPHPSRSTPRRHPAPRR